ncbi:hypothetical protein [Novosphingobium sp. ZW T3_23]|uniref:hypothetical protein n=1 Tax=Novosphingobium sp. ZW T3_23 TaxID=3378084 RepID=UPI0038519138
MESSDDSENALKQKFGADDPMQSDHLFKEAGASSKRNAPFSTGIRKPEMKAMNTSRLAMIAVVAAGSLGLAACNNKADDATEQQADAVEQSSDAAADALENQADTMTGAASEAVQEKADAVEAAGEAKSDALENKADEIRKQN